MPEGVFDNGAQVDVGVAAKAVSNRNRGDEPAPDPLVAPKGWRRDRKTGEWVPRQRASASDVDVEVAEPGTSRAESAWVDGPDGRELGAAETGRVGPAVLTGQQRADLEAVLELLALPVLVPLSVRDPHCGGALVDNWDNIREKSVPVICKSPRLVDWLTRGGGMLDYLALAAALRPVGVAVWEHHIVRSVGTGDDDVVVDDFAA